VLVAIAEEGFRLLSVEVESAISQTSTTRLQLIAASNAYVNFALNHPNHCPQFSPFRSTRVVMRTITVRLKSP